MILGVLFDGFGVVRFYKGDIGLGIGKLGLLVLGAITSFIGIGGLFIFALWIWCIIDWFLAWKGIKKDNLNKILALLE